MRACAWGACTGWACSTSLAPADQVVGVERVAGHVQRRALVLHRHADDGVLGAVGQLAHDGSAPRWLRRRASARLETRSWNSFRNEFPSISARNLALARWSSIGVPSPASTCAAASTVSASQAVPPAPPRWRAPGWAWPRPRRVRCAPCGPVPSATSIANADRHRRDVVEGPLGDLVERRRGRGREGYDDLGDQLARLADGLAVAGEVLAQRHGSLTVGRGENHARLESQQHRGRVADGRAGAEVATERGAVADQP